MFNLAYHLTRGTPIRVKIKGFQRPAVGKFSWLAYGRGRAFFQMKPKKTPFRALQVRLKDVEWLEMGRLR